MSRDAKFGHARLTLLRERSPYALRKSCVVTVDGCSGVTARHADRQSLVRNIITVVSVATHEQHANALRLTVKVFVAVTTAAAAAASAAAAAAAAVVRELSP